MASSNKSAGYARIVISRAGPHENGVPGCNGCRVRINGACASCSTYDLMRKGVELAKRGRPAPKVIRWLKEARDARYAGDFGRAYAAAAQAVAALQPSPSTMPSA